MVSFSKIQCLVHKKKYSLSKPVCGGSYLNCVEVMVSLGPSPLVTRGYQEHKGDTY